MKQAKSWIGKWFGLRGALRARAKHGTVPRIHSISEFRDIIRKERGRVDRNSHCFSMAVFEMPDSDREGPYAKRLVSALVEYARFTDPIGWLGEADIGVLLPETQGTGAWMFVDRIRVAMLGGGFLPSPKVYTYPSEGESKSDAGDRQMWLAGLESFRRGNAITDDHPTVVGAVAMAPLRTGELVAVQPMEDALQGYFERPLPWWKRTMDVVGSGSALLLLSPVMLGMVALIKLVSPGPVFFKQERVGYLGRKFTCLKFRTMHVRQDVSSHRQHLSHLIHSEAPMTKLDNKSDPRIIPMGNMLRQLAIDELPQLWNVFRGQMSLVGPRPCIPYEYAEYRIWQRTRTLAVPGLTGLWQVCGKNNTTFKEMMRLDITYAQRMSFWLDLHIMVMTIPVIVGQVRDGLRARRARRACEGRVEVAV